MIENTISYMLDVPAETRLIQILESPSKIVDLRLCQNLSVSPPTTRLGDRTTSSSS